MQTDASFVGGKRFSIINVRRLNKDIETVQRVSNKQCFKGSSEVGNRPLQECPVPLGRMSYYFGLISYMRSNRFYMQKVIEEITCSIACSDVLFDYSLDYPHLNSITVNLQRVPVRRPGVLQNEPKIMKLNFHFRRAYKIVEGAWIFFQLKSLFFLSLALRYIPPSTCLLPNLYIHVRSQRCSKHTDFKVLLEVQSAHILRMCQCGGLRSFLSDYLSKRTWEHLCESFTKLGESSLSNTDVLNTKLRSSMAFAKNI